MIHNILQAKASLGRCHNDSLNFLCQRDSFIAIACCHASNLTFIASYIIITVNVIAIANKSWLTQYFIAIAVVKETTTEEWTEGIHQLQRDLDISIFQVFNLTKIHFKNTVTTKVIAGINNKCS